MKKISLFDKVKTPHGEGLVIGINVESNGISIYKDTSTVKVWYGMDNSIYIDYDGRYSYYTYKLKDITLVLETITPLEELIINLQKRVEYLESKK